MPCPALHLQPKRCLAWLNTVDETRQVGRPSAAARCAATSVSSVQMTWPGEGWEHTQASGGFEEAHSDQCTGMMWVCNSPALG